MKRLLLLAALAVLAAPAALAAKVELTWTNPSAYSTGAALPALAYETAYWGTCSSGQTPVIATALGSQRVGGTVPGASMFAWIFPSGKGPFCFALTATDPSGATSPRSSTVEWTPPQTLGAPMQLGAVFHLTLRPPS